MGWYNELGLFGNVVIPRAVFGREPSKRTLGVDENLVRLTDTLDMIGPFTP